MNKMPLDSLLIVSDTSDQFAIMTSEPELDLAKPARINGTISVSLAVRLRLKI